MQSITDKPVTVPAVLPRDKFSLPQSTAHLVLQVWRREVPLDVFAATEASRYVAEGLGAFCDPLVDVLDEFEQQLLLNKQRLLTSVEKMQKAHGDYEQRRGINHQFVL